MVGVLWRFVIWEERVFGSGFEFYLRVGKVIGWLYEGIL